MPSLREGMGIIMADFCKQCSIDIFMEDYGDLRRIAEEGDKAYVICEGCGPTLVNHDGECIGDCDKKHGPEALPTGSS